MMNRVRQNRCWFQGAALAIVVGLLCSMGLGCGDDDEESPVGPEPLGEIVGDWYIYTVQLSFAADGTFTLSDNVLGAYTMCETGTYVLNRTTRILSGTVTVDLNGDYGMGEGVGATFALPVIQLTDTRLAVTTDDGTETLTRSAPNTPEGTLTEDFSSPTLNYDLWWIASRNDGSVSISNGQANLRAESDGSNYGSWDLDLRICGYTQIQADIRVTVAEVESNCCLRWRPYGDQTVNLGIHRSSNGDLYLFSQGHPAGPHIRSQSLGSAVLGTYYTFRMTWDGTTVRFYVDGAEVDSYAPHQADVSRAYTEGIEIDTWCKDGAEVRANADNVVATP